MQTLLQPSREQIPLPQFPSWCWVAGAALPLWAADAIGARADHQIPPGHRTFHGEVEGASPRVAFEPCTEHKTHPNAFFYLQN